MRSFGFSGDMAPCCSWPLLEKAMDFSKQLKCQVLAGPIFSSDAFYGENTSAKVLGELGVLAVEMEAAALYVNAAKAGKNALAICSISDSLITGEELSAMERQEGFHDMMLMGLSLV